LKKLKKPDNAKDLAKFCAKIAQDKIAKDLLILDLSAIESAPADYFVICTAMSDVQSEAILLDIERKSKYIGIDSPKVEGRNTQEWVLLDFFDVVVHIMLEKSREFYKLEKLWGDGEFYTLSETGRTVKAKSLDILNL
jgi:ribosome-associated protein